MCRDRRTVSGSPPCQLHTNKQTNKGREIENFVVRASTYIHTHVHRYICMYTCLFLFFRLAIFLRYLLSFSSRVSNADWLDSRYKLSCHKQRQQRLLALSWLFASFSGADALCSRLVTDTHYTPKTTVTHAQHTHNHMYTYSADRKR